jgi:alpha-ketoglutarate-dependent taurine dioxygenase
MPLHVRNLTPTIGAEVEGFDPRAPIDDAVARALVDAFDEWGVLVLRGVDLDPADQHRVAETILAGVPATAEEGDATAFSYVSNREENGGAPYGRLLFHTDMMWSELARQVASLFAVHADQPSVPTVFTSAVHAWATLPDDLRARVAGLHARHESGQQGRGVTAHEDELLQPQWTQERSIVTPVALPHPRTGRTMLYVCEQQTREIVELPKEESDALLDALFAHLYDPERCYTHEWRQGDLVLWDNQAAQHGRPYVVADGPARTLRKIHAPRGLAARVGTPTYQRAS